MGAIPLPLVAQPTPSLGSSLVNATPMQLVEAALEWTRQRYIIRSNIKVLLVRRATPADTAFIGPDCNSTDRPCAIIALEGYFESRDGKNGPVHYLVYTFDLKDGLPIVESGSWDGERFRKPLNMPRLGEWVPRVPEEPTTPQSQNITPFASTRPQAFGVRCSTLARTISTRPCPRAIKTPSYWGAEAVVSNPDSERPPIPIGQYINSPVGVTDLRGSGQTTYIEAGPERYCTRVSTRTQCVNRAYAAWGRKPGGPDNFERRFSIVLEPNVTYRYGVKYLWELEEREPPIKNRWQAEYCIGSSCKSIFPNSALPDLRVRSLPYAAGGGESSNFNIGWGSFYISQFKFRPIDYKKTTLISGCYTSKVEAPKPDAFVTTCNNYSWFAHYTP
jgi:hypothetical protein